MKMVFWAGVGTLFPFLMTTLGAALVFLIKKQSEDGPCMGFAAGVMSAAAVFSMILPAMRQNEGGWLIVTLGFMLGAAMNAMRFSSISLLLPASTSWPSTLAEMPLPLIS